MPPAKAPKKKSTPITTKPEPTPPNWPPLRPLVPSTDLYIEPLLTDQIYIIRNFFTGSLCKSYVSFLTSPSSAVDLITTPLKPKSRDHAVRVNDRFQVQDASFAEMLWGMTCLKDVVCERRGVEAENDGDNKEEAKNARIWGGTPLGLNPNIRIYRYTPGQFFAQHCTPLLSTDPTESKANEQTTNPTPFNFLTSQENQHQHARRGLYSSTSLQQTAERQCSTRKMVLRRYLWHPRSEWRFCIGMESIACCMKGRKCGRERSG